ncbi:putative glycosyl transferase [Botrytis cinerea]
MISLHYHRVGVGGGEKDGESSSGKGAEKIIHQVWHNWEGGFGRRVERRGGGTVEGKGKGGEEENGIGKGKISIAEDKEGWEATGGDGEIPREWDERRRHCRGINGQSGWKYVLWTSEKSLFLIKTHYPSFLQTYISYPTHSQRVDAVKYLLLHKYGGVVMDLDTICLRSLDPFLMLGLFVLSEPTSVSASLSASSFSAGNYGGDGKGMGSLEMRIMGAQKNHGFVVELVDVLMGYNAPGVEGDRDGNRGVEKLSLEEKRMKGERVMRGRREVFGEVWDAYHRRIEEGILDVDVGASTNSSARVSDEREEEYREEMGLVDSVGWRVSVLRQGEGAGRGLFGKWLNLADSFSLLRSRESRLSHRIDSQIRNSVLNPE